MASFPPVQARLTHLKVPVESLPLYPIWIQLSSPAMHSAFHAAACPGATLKTSTITKNRWAGGLLQYEKSADPPLLQKTDTDGVAAIRHDRYLDVFIDDFSFSLLPEPSPPTPRVLFPSHSGSTPWFVILLIHGPFWGDRLEPFPRPCRRHRPCSFRAD